MQHQLLIRFSIIAGVILSIFGTACQESKGRKFEQGNVIGTYSQSQIINESIEPFLSSDQYETAVDELGKLTPLAYFEQTFTGLAIGNIVIDSETLEISEDEIFGLKEHYTKLNLSYNSMAQMWDENNFNPYVLTSSDFKNA
ncbi:MAG: hypothetical protein NTX25_03015, partial [Proteobacteria bacterium]|nr:hypothetical protein [Pseudomonadota bacterium]